MGRPARTVPSPAMRAPPGPRSGKPGRCAGSRGMLAPLGRSASGERSVMVPASRLRSLPKVLSPWLILFATLAAAPPKDDENPSLPPAASDDLTAHAAALFEAIKAGKPELGEAFFFPREPFLVLKDVDDPAHYYRDLLSAY